MPFYDVQITTDLGETVVLQIAASSPEEAELTGSVPFSVSAAISSKPVSFGYRCKVS